MRTRREGREVARRTEQRDERFTSEEEAKRISRM